MSEIAFDEMVLSVLRAHKFAPHAQVLDVGCGDGALDGLLATRLVAGVDGIDVIPLSIELACTEFEKRSLSGCFLLIDGYA